VPSGGVASPSGDFQKIVIFRISEDG